MIKNIVFDMGQVIFYFEGRFFIEKAGAQGKDVDLIYDELFVTKKWSRLDDATMTESELVESVNDNLPKRLHDVVRKVVYRWDEHIVCVPGMLELIRDLKNDGYNLYLLSNAGPRHKDYWKRIPASEFFDGVVVSCYEKTVKPDEKIFNILLNRYFLKAEECFFVDDLKDNVATAERLGMKGFVFDNNVDELRNHLKWVI